MARHRPALPCVWLRSTYCLCDVQPSTDTVALIEEHGQAALALKVDITKESQVKEAVDEIMANGVGLTFWLTTHNQR